jgi:hypothetical protein
VPPDASPPLSASSHAFHAVLRRRKSGIPEVLIEVRPPTPATLHPIIPDVHFLHRPKNYVGAY